MRIQWSLFAVCAGLAACAESANESMFTFNDAAPVVAIIAPADGAQFYQRAPLAIQVSAVDDFADLEGLNIGVTSNIDGVLEGQLVAEEAESQFTWSLPTGLESPGTHTLTVQAIDGSGNAGAGTLTLDILENSAPVATFIAPLEGLYISGQPLLVVLQVDDADEPNLNELTLTWQDDADLPNAPSNPGSDGMAELVITDPTAGTSVLRVQIEDSFGRTTEATKFVEFIDGDLDQDGFLSIADGGDDCNDEDSDIHPSADELCDGVDDNCSGDETDAKDTSTFYADADGDGFGDEDDTTHDCQAPSGYVADATDCDDSDSRSFPDADETCDALDNDCDGKVDEGVTTTFYADADNDQYGDSSDKGTKACSAPKNTVTNAADCDDKDGNAHPGGVELCNGADNNCDGDNDNDAVDAVAWYVDSDDGVGDGYGDPDTETLACDAPTASHVQRAGDCEPGDSDIHPDADEHCDGVDEDCDGVVDNSPVTGGDLYFVDADGDGHGDINDAGTRFCDEPSGLADSADDCDDKQPLAFPGALELCDGIDNDCDELTTDADSDDASLWYPDVDKDGFGDEDHDGTLSCEPIAAHVLDNTDCHDDSSISHPGADEICDTTFDNNCDGETDEDAAVDAPDWYPDGDDGFGDGFGVLTGAVAACEAPGPLFADNAMDCDGTDAGVHPDADETCNDIDDDCDGIKDEDPISGGDLWFIDKDGDGHGDLDDDGTILCGTPLGYADIADDCDDNQPRTYPGYPEICDGFDNDCDDKTTEEDADQGTLWYPDVDRDTYGDKTATGTPSCAPVLGMVLDHTDCHDDSKISHPGADEICDGTFDNNCDGTVDEDSAVDAVAWYADVDDGVGDGYGDPKGVTQTACDAPALGWVDNKDDCDPTRSAVYPGADEVCNELDDDCDGDTDEDPISGGDIYFVDVDNDQHGDENDGGTRFCELPLTHAEAADDCDDNQPLRFKGNPELCDGLDNDCDDDTSDDSSAEAMLWYPDVDEDQFGDEDETGVKGCEQPSGHVLDNTDCLDDPEEHARAADVHPGGIETCDGTLDENCDDQVDEANAIDALPWFEDDDQGEGDGYGVATTMVFACVDPGDGWVDNDADCDGTRSDIHPGADEVCNELDDDCDGDTDEDPVGGGDIYYVDADQDGHGDENDEGTRFCELPSTHVEEADDCDDNQPLAFLGNPELCDGIDNDCDDDTSDDSSAEASLWYPDVDEDQFGDEDETGVKGCEQPSGYVLDNTDCLDDPEEHARAADVHPGGIETCDGELDENCDDSIDEDDAIDALTWYLDVDGGQGDGFGDMTSSVVACDPGPGWVTNAGDCDGDRYDINPDADEICNGLDDDCDIEVDEDPVSGGAIYFVDLDNDQHGDENDEGTRFCDLPSTHAEEADDCDDTQPLRFKGNPELCDGLDNDCDDDTSEDSSAEASLWYPDVDEDKFGDEDATGSKACDQPDGYVLDNTDCLDDLEEHARAADVHPGGIETCDGELDENCDDSIDENDAIDAVTWYLDVDEGEGDGFGDPQTMLVACNPGQGWVTNAGDCDGDRYDINPDASEICNGQDDDCDGDVDEDPVSGGDIYYVDLDNDQHGDENDGGTRFCDLPSTHAEDADDCDDTQPLRFKGNPELCDGLDNDCDDDTSEDSSDEASLWYPDVDEDQFGDEDEAGVKACEPPDGYVLDNTDCLDDPTVHARAAEVHPGGIETCDGTLDENCNDDIDEADAVDALTWYEDDESGGGDGYGVPFNFKIACTDPGEGWADNAGDCDDTRMDIHPGADEVCNEIDDDCDLDVDEDPVSGGDIYYVDNDQDGHGDENATGVRFCVQPATHAEDPDDCDDTHPLRFNFNPELCDGIDNDCDDDTSDDTSAEASLWYPDADGDRFGDELGKSVASCTQVAGRVLDNTDCHDNSAVSHPGAVEICDTLFDNDCNGLTDEAAAVDALVWYADVDTDGFGDADASLAACDQPAGYVDNDLDCDPNNGDSVPTYWWADTDGDTYGDPDVRFVACDQPADTSDNTDDCDDTNENRYDAAPDTCAGLDGNCDGFFDLDVPADCATIQSALNGAKASGLESTITVASGTYQENLVITGGNVTLIAPAGATIDGNNVDLKATIRVQSGQATVIDGFSVINGMGFKVYSETYGGGFYVKNTPDLTLRNLHISDNEATWFAGGIYASNSTIDVENCIIADNTAPRQGAAIATSGSDIYLRNSFVVRTTGGMNVMSSSGGSFIRLENTVVANNDSGNAIGALSSVDVLNSAIINNTGGIVSAGNGSTTVNITNTDLVGNTSSYLYGSDGSQINVNYSNTSIYSLRTINNNMNVAPGYVDVTDTDPWNWDLTLGAGSLMINTGDVDIDDPDTSRSDVGAYGGPGAADW
jgi:hypothetical protein